MDFWSRWIGRGGRPSPKKSNDNHPQQRLERLKRATEYLAKVWRQSKTRPLETSSVNNVRLCLQSIARILQDENYASPPFLCVQYAANSRIYTAATEIAISTSDEAIISEVLVLLKLLADSEESNVLIEPAYAASTTTFATEICKPGLISSETETFLYEVLFSVAAKLKLQPENIPSWFRRGARRTEEALEEYTVQATDSRGVVKDFPLFYVFLNHVHHDGKVGEFARTGLLYLIGLAARSDLLERWIVESDLATLMASGLGALYSQLSRKLAISHDKDSTPLMIAFSHDAQSRSASDAVETSSAEFREGLATFLNYLMFWQDVLENSTSEDVKETLLDHFDFLFLKQLLYPSLLESSDVDGGFVAVLTYLRCILLTTSHPDLVHRILHYLLALPETAPSEDSSSRPATLARRRKSESLIQKQAANIDEPSPHLFTLVDMILCGLKSHSEQTVATTLRLLGTILSRQHQYAIPGLLQPQIASGGPHRSLSAHDRSIDILLDLAENLTNEDLDSIYEQHLQDARVLLQTHVCSAELLTLPSTAAVPSQETFSKRQLPCSPTVNDHTISPNDSLLESMLSTLDQFFSNDVETNLSLTQALAIMISCGHTRLEGWFLNANTQIEDLSQDALTAPARNSGVPDANTPGQSAEEKPAIPDTKEPSPIYVTEDTTAFFKALVRLVDQAKCFEREIQDFGIHLAEQKHLIKVGEEIEMALEEAPVFSRVAGGSKDVSPNRSRAPLQVVSVSERLLSNSNSANVSRTGSPRGRQRSEPSGPSLVGRLTHLRVSSSPNPSKNSGVHTASSLRRESFSSTPSKGLPGPTGLTNAVHQNIRVPLGVNKKQTDTFDTGSSEVSSAHSESIEPELGQRKQYREVSLSSILTNVIILQEFLLELAAIVEVRAGLFGEVSLS